MPKLTSRLRPQYEAAQAELEQLTARRDALKAQGQPVDANTTYGIQIKSGVVSKLKAMVDAEEAAVVDLALPDHRMFGPEVRFSLPCFFLTHFRYFF